MTSAAQTLARTWSWSSGISVPAALRGPCTYHPYLPDLPEGLSLATVHRQFETIHPFTDGNGRTGRALIQLVLERRGLSTSILPPTGLALRAYGEAYFAALSAGRYVGPAESAEAITAIAQWLRLVSVATRPAVSHAQQLHARIAEQVMAWRQQMSHRRAGAAALHLLPVLPQAPVFTVNTALPLLREQAGLTRSFQAVSPAIDQLLAAGILEVDQRYRIGWYYRVPAVIELIEDVETGMRGLALVGPSPSPT